MIVNGDENGNKSSDVDNKSKQLKFEFFLKNEKGLIIIGEEEDKAKMSNTIKGIQNRPNLIQNAESKNIPLPIDNMNNKNNGPSSNIQVEKNSLLDKNNLININKIKKVSNESQDQIPRKNLLYPQYIESDKQNNVVDEKKLSSLKEKLFNNAKPQQILLTNKEEFLDWNYYNEQYEVVEIKKDEIESNACKKIKIENLLFTDVGKISSNSEKDEIKHPIKIANSPHKENNLDKPENKKTNEEIVNVKELLIDNVLPMNNFKSDKLKQDYLFKNQKEVKPKKKLRISEYFYNFIKNSIKDVPSNLTQTIIIPQSELNNFKASKINIIGEEQTEHKCYMPKHHKYQIDTSEKKKNYRNTQLVGQVDEEVTMYFKNSNTVDTYDYIDNKFADLNYINEGKIIKLENSDLYLYNKGKNLNLFSDLNDDEETGLDNHINKKVINKDSQIKLIQDKIKNRNKPIIVNKSERKVSLPAITFKLSDDNVKTYHSDFVDDWI